jgi:hypothetical protein
METAEIGIVFAVLIILQEIAWYKRWEAIFRHRFSKFGGLFPHKIFVGNPTSWSLSRLISSW